MWNKTIGAVLILSGTSIGAGMLALPVTLGPLGMVPAVLFLCVCAALLAYSMFLLLEIALSYQGEQSNYITLVGGLLGKPGQAVAWICCLLLLYSAAAAYLAGGSPIVEELLQQLGADFLGDVTGLIVFFFGFGLVAMFKTQLIDSFNRVLMFLLALSFFIMVFGLANNNSVMHVHFDSWQLGHLWAAAPVVMLSFSCHPVFLSLCHYCDYNMTALKRAVLISFAIPTGLYLVWLIAVMGIIPVTGSESLLQIAKAQHPVSALTLALANQTGLNWLHATTAAFSFFALATSYLAVSLSLIDFIEDGLPAEIAQGRRVLSVITALLPPLCFAYFFESGFIFALGYAGVFVSILYILLPTLMVWRLRKAKKSSYQVFGGTAGLVVMLLLGVATIASQLAAA